MKGFPLLLLPVLAFWLFAGAGCKPERRVDATQPLEQSFQDADPAVKKAIEETTANLRARKYAEATRALAPVVSGRPLTEPQRQAVGVALQQINQAITADPALDSQEMYELRARMFRAVHNGSRF